MMGNAPLPTRAPQTADQDRLAPWRMLSRAILPIAHARFQSIQSIGNHDITSTIARRIRPVFGSLV